MKTPRQILFERHQNAGPRLDDVRQKALAALRPVSTVPPRQPAVFAWRDFVLSLRWHLAGMSAVWIAVVLLNADYPAGPARTVAGQDIPAPRQILASLQIYRHQLLELMGPPAVEPAIAPRRRSELFQPINTIV